MWSEDCRGGDLLKHANRVKRDLDGLTGDSNITTSENRQRAILAKVGVGHLRHNRQRRHKAVAGTRQIFGFDLPELVVDQLADLSREAFKSRA